VDEFAQRRLNNLGQFHLGCGRRRRPRNGTCGTINDNPILNNRSYSGVVTVKQGETVELISELDKSETRAISGVPGLSEIPGLNNTTGKDTQKSYATLLILITPHVVRGTQAAGRSPMMRIDKSGSQ